MTPKIVGYIDYITVQGDMFDNLALAAYNEEKMATHIIKENPEYCDVLIFDAGVHLQIPILDIIETPNTLPPWRRN